jgi:hypothetical protein
MTLIENKVTSIQASEDKAATYADLLVSLLNRPLTKAVDLKSMRRDLRLMDTLEAAGETIEVSDEDFKFLADLVDNSEWVVKHKDIVQFADYIDSLKSNS